MAGGFQIEIERQVGSEFSARSGAMRPPTFAYAGVRLWSDEPMIQIDPQTIIIGHLFSRGPPSRRIVSLSPGEGQRLAADKARLLLDGYWGGYLMVRIDEAGAVRILRDPSGALPCYFLCEADRITLAGDIADLASPAPGQVDFEEIARVIASGDARGRRTCLRGIDELIAGECIVIDRSHVSIEPWWTPWDHVDPPLEMEVADAAVRLRETITDCVGTWASCFSSILLGASGGLDSSIVAAAAAPRADRLTCLTLFGPDFDGDERRYAAALADSLGLDLREASREIGDIDITRAAGPHHPWPVVPLGAQTNEAIHRRLQKELSIDAYFTGNGGDGILCSIRSAVPFLDRFLAEGPRLALSDTLRDICVLTGADKMTVLRHAWSRYRRAGGRHVVQYNASGLCAEFVARIEASGATHPWLAAPDDVLPGKTVHAAYLMRTQQGVELYPRAVSPPHIAPLLSQPIVELCLSIPTWMWISGGLNRAVARKAFEGRLPAIITRRTQKGGPGGFDLAIYRRNRAALLEHLRGGLLVDAGIVDTTLLDEPEDRSWRGTERIQHILALGAAESWARWWSAPRI
jgi:asparagine synthase (glutamine-hydrolysing)